MIKSIIQIQSPDTSWTGNKMNNHIKQTKFEQESTGFYGKRCKGWDLHYLLFSTTDIYRENSMLLDSYQLGRQQSTQRTFIHLCQMTNKRAKHAAALWNSALMIILWQTCYPWINGHEKFWNYPNIPKFQVKRSMYMYWITLLGTFWCKEIPFICF